MLWSATNPNLPGWVDAPATTTPLGSNRAPELLGRGHQRAHGVHLHEGVDGDRPAVDDDQRVEVGRAQVGVGLGRRDRPSEHVDQRRPVDGGLAPERAEQRLGREVVDHVLGVDRVDRARGGCATSATASARMPPTPSITVMPNCGSSVRPAISSRLPCTIGATRTATSPSSGVAAASSSAAAAAHGVGVGRGRAARGRARSCGRWRRR